MQAGKLLYAGSFRLGEQSAWAPQMLHVIDSLDDTTEANVLFSVARNVHGLWSAVAPYRVIQAMPSSSVPFEVVKRSNERPVANISVRWRRTDT